MNISTRMLFCIFLVENIIDGICTVVGVKNGAVEINPVINFFMNLHGPLLGMIVAKVIAVMMISCMLLILLLKGRIKEIRMILWFGIIAFSILDFIIHPYVLWVISQS
jgi:hypothetical protein